MKSNCCNSDLVRFNDNYNECFVCGRLHIKMNDNDIKKILEKYYFTNDYTRQNLIDEINEYAHIVFQKNNAPKSQKFSFMPPLPDGLICGSNCDDNYKNGWIDCWNELQKNKDHENSR